MILSELVLLDLTYLIKFIRCKYIAVYRTAISKLLPLSRGVFLGKEMKTIAKLSSINKAIDFINFVKHFLNSNTNTQYDEYSNMNASSFIILFIDML